MFEVQDIVVFIVVALIVGIALGSTFIGWWNTQTINKYKEAAALEAQLADTNMASALKFQEAAINFRTLYEQQPKLRVRVSDPTTNEFHRVEEFDNLETGFQYIRQMQPNWNLVVTLVYKNRPNTSLSLLAS